MAAISMFPSERNLFFIAAVVAAVGSFVAVSELDGLFLSTKLAYAPYVTVITPAIFLYLYFSKRLLAQFSRIFSWKFLIALVWWSFGCVLGYAAALLGCFGLMYLATRFGYLSWISIGLTVHNICVASLALAAAVCATLIGFSVVKHSAKTNQIWQPRT